MTSRKKAASDKSSMFKELKKAVAELGTIPDIDNPDNAKLLVDELSNKGVPRADAIVFCQILENIPDRSKGVTSKDLTLISSETYIQEDIVKTIAPIIPDLIIFEDPLSIDELGHSSNGMSFKLDYQKNAAELYAYTGQSRHIYIPYKVKTPLGLTFDVVSLEAAFKNNQIIKTIRIPKTIESISLETFDDCPSLESIIIEDNEDVIGFFTNDGVLYLSEYSKELKSPYTILLRYPPGKTEEVFDYYKYDIINEFAFDQCTHLKYLILPNHTCIIRKYAFIGCTSLEYVSCDFSQLIISDTAFLGCTAIDQINDGIIDPNTFKTKFGNLHPKEETDNDSSFLDQVSPRYNYSQYCKLGDPDISLENCNDILTMIKWGKYSFSTPVKKEISQGPHEKKRFVYNFNKNEMMVLSLIAKRMHVFEYLFNSNLYSFRFHNRLLAAISYLKNECDLNDLYVYKTDLKDYFGTIPTENLLSELRDRLNIDVEDPKLYTFIENMLTGDESEYKGKIIHEPRGILMGTPLAPFLSNFYLSDIDEEFSKKDCHYLRYCDDILILSPNYEDILFLHDCFVQLVEEKGLSVNVEKDRLYMPGEAFDYLGLTFSGNFVDISKSSFKRIKGKIRTTANIYRKCVVNGKKSPEQAAMEYISSINRYFYGRNEKSYSFSKWYFPLINVPITLQELDSYFQDCIRYVVTGKFSKKNYKIVPLRLLYKWGFRPLETSFSKG